MRYYGPRALRWPGIPDWINFAYYDGDDVVVECSRFDNQGINYDRMTELSELFGTRMINAGSEDRSGGYCETCAYTYEVMTARISKITRRPDGSEEYETG